MRILHTVEFYEPRKGGAELVVKELSERLAKAGHEVTVATSFDKRRGGILNGVKIEQFAISGNSATGIVGDPAEVRRYQELLGAGFDVVMSYAAQSWTTDLALDAAYRITGKKVLVPCGYSGLNNPAYADYFRQLPGKLATYDALIYMSQHYQDKLFGDMHGLADKAIYIPNGASAEEFLGESSYDFRKKFSITTKYMVLCVSNHYLAKGHDFVMDAFRRMNRSDTTLVVIGKTVVGSGLRQLGHFILDYCRCKARALLHSRIRLVDTDDRRAVVSAYKQADVFLFGSRVECAPLVMYEAFASKTPFITRPAGNVADHKDVLKIVPTPAEMARVANSILDDAGTARDIADRAFELWQRNHTWEAIAERYQQLYKELLLR